MSTVLTYDNGDYKILMTDTRVTHANREYNDNAQKMHYIENFGFIAGIGLAEYIHDVFTQFISDDNQTIEQLCKLCTHNYHTNSDKISKEDIVEGKGINNYNILNNSSIIAISTLGVYIINKDNQNPTDSKEKENHIKFKIPYNLSEMTIQKLAKIEQKNGKRGIQQALLEMLEGFEIIANEQFPNSSTDTPCNFSTVSKICCIGIINYKEKPFYIEGDVSYLINILKETQLERIKNQFDQCKNKLINWNSVDASEKFNNKIEIYPVNDTYNQN